MAAIQNVSCRIQMMKKNANDKTSVSMRNINFFGYSYKASSNVCCRGAETDDQYAFSFNVVRPINT